MAENNITLRTDINTHLDACDALNHAWAMTDFLQSVLTLQNGGEILEQLPTTGLYYIMEDIKDRIKHAEYVLSKPDTGLFKIAATNT